MKHPALTRALAVVLAVFCLVTLIAGVGSLRKTHRQHEEDLRRQQVLGDRIARAEGLRQSLDEQERSYRIAATGLEKREERHERALSDYRGRLATYTATRAGIRMGREALEQASDALWYGKKKFEDGYAQFQQGAAAVNEIYSLYSRIKNSVQNGTEVYLRGLSYLENEADEELEALLTPEEVLAALRVTRSGLGSLENLLQALIDYPDGDPAAVEQIRNAEQLLSSLSDELGEVDPQALAQRAVTRILDQADEAVQARIDAGASESEALAEADAVTQAALGMSYGEARDWLQQNAAAAAGTGASSALADLDPDQLSAMMEGFGGQDELLRQALAVLREEEEALDGQEAALRADPAAVTSSEALLALLKTELDAAQKIFDIVSGLIETVKQQMDAIAAQMAQAGKAIEDGITMIARNRLKLSQQEEELDAQHDDMMAEKEKLETEKARLDRRRQTVDTYTEDEKSFRSARAALMSYENIETAVKDGADLIDAAKTELERMTAEQREEMIRRAAVAGILLLAALVGWISVAGAFEKPKIKHLWIPTAATALLAALCEAGSLWLGRGLWYSALALLLAALALLPLTIQRTKA